jgi:hypothetical protein
MAGQPKLTTKTGYVNKQRQVVIRNTGRHGTDHLQYIYTLGCSDCGCIYGANGSDIHERKCPKCQGGAAGLKQQPGTQRKTEAPNCFHSKILLALLRYSTRTETLERLHDAIEQAIETASKNAKASDDEISLAEECDAIEELLGIAFVAAQSYITSVRTRLIDIAKAYPLERGRPAIFDDRTKIFEKSGTLPSAPRYTRVEATDAIANYWKHVDQWDTSTVHGERTWKADRYNTADIVTAIGLSPGSTGNLRTAAKAVGIRDFSNLWPIREDLAAWAKSLYQEAERYIHDRETASGKST